MQQIRGCSLPAKIHEVLSRWLEGIVKVQTCRRDEIVNAINRHQSKNPQLQKEKGYSNLKCMIKVGDCLYLGADSKCRCSQIHMMLCISWYNLCPKSLSILLFSFGYWRLCIIICNLSNFLIGLDWIGLYFIFISTYCAFCSFNRAALSIRHCA